MQLTVRDVAKLLHVSEKTIYRWLRQKTIPAYRVNDQYRFNRAELLEWAASRRIQAAPEILAEPESEASRLPGLDEALRTGGIYYRVEGADRASVLQATASLLRVPEGIEREYLFQLLMSRESLAPTGIGDGIAIPHARNPLVLETSAPMIAISFLEKPIEWGALDGRPVTCLFVPVSASARAHLHLLARIMFGIQDASFRGLIQQQGTREDILDAAARLEQVFAARSPAS